MIKSRYISAPRSWPHKEYKCFDHIHKRLVFRHIQCLHLMYSEVAWVLVSAGTQVQPQIILYPDDLPDSFSLSHYYVSKKHSKCNDIGFFSQVLFYLTNISLCKTGYKINFASCIKRNQKSWTSAFCWSLDRKLKNCSKRQCRNLEFPRGFFKLRNGARTLIRHGF